MTLNSYLVRDGTGTIIGQYQTSTRPSKPEEWNGEWKVEKVDISELNTEPVEWWDEQS